MWFEPTTAGTDLPVLYRLSYEASTWVSWDNLGSEFAVYIATTGWLDNNSIDDSFSKHDQTCRRGFPEYNIWFSEKVTQWWSKVLIQGWGTRPRKRILFIDPSTRQSIGLIIFLWVWNKYLVPVLDSVLSSTFDYKLGSYIWMTSIRFKMIVNTEKE